jgi:MoaA/NifB/PqqE/SkfB family radical SAM enzyme
MAPHLRRLLNLLERRPLSLGIETINICNARCVFCAYPKMRRPKQVLEQEIFAKAIDDYVDMGGGAVRLTPTMGDVLLDPHFLDRLRLMRSRPEIGQVYVVTNGIAWDRYTPAQQQFIVESIDWLGLSIGGLDAPSYERMYGVDRFEKARAAVHSACDLKGSHNPSMQIHLAFRADRPLRELQDDPKMDPFRRPEIDRIAGGNEYLNWGGLVTEDDLPPGARLLPADDPDRFVPAAKKNPCFLFFFEPTVTSSGMVTVCGCQDAEAQELILGDIRQEHLADMWAGPTFRQFKEAFGTDHLPEICRCCTLYQDGERFIRSPELVNFEVGLYPLLLTHTQPADPSALALSRALVELQQQGYQRIALYGAGRFTRRALAVKAFEFEAYPLVAVLDDNPDLHGTHIGRLPIVEPGSASSLGVDAVILATDTHTDALWEASAPLREAGVRVVPLGGACDAANRPEPVPAHQ